MTDMVNHPPHYKYVWPVEVIEITESMNFCLGNTIKYIARAGVKTENPIEDLEKARWYLDREIERLKLEKAMEEQLEYPYLVTESKIELQELFEEENK